MSVKKRKIKRERKRKTNPHANPHADPHPIENRESKIENPPITPLAECATPASVRAS
jgi:hypothetical protein